MEFLSAVIEGVAALGRTVQSHTNLPSISRELVQFADDLKPSAEYEDIGKRQLDMIFRSLQAHSEYSVARCLPAGSVGKRTSVLYPDFDAVVFLNGKQPPLTESIINLYSFLEKKAEEFKIIPHSIKASSNSIFVRFKNGLEVDLLPACNLTHSPYRGEQHLLVMEKIRESPQLYMNYSSSLADIQIRFLSVQNTEVHQLIRLVKYWYKTVGEKVYGGSYLMEVISVAVYHGMRRDSDSLRLLDIFKETVKSISKIRELRIAFLYDGNRTWELLLGNEALFHRDRFGPAILNQSGFIVDPTNPWNNLMANVTATVAARLEECANEMLERLDILQSAEDEHYKSCTDGNVFIKLDTLFAPFKINYLLDAKPKLSIVDCDYHLHYKDTFSNTIVTWRTRNEVVRALSEEIRNTLASLVRAQVKRVFDTAGNRPKFAFSNGLAKVASKASVKEAVLTFQKQVSAAVRESSLNTDHRNCDVTLLIPYIFEEQCLAVRCSMVWVK